MEYIVKQNLLLMKRAVIIFIVIILVVFLGCEKMYKEDDLNVYTISSANELDNLTAGLYYSLANTYFSSAEGLFGNSDDVVLNSLYSPLDLIETIYTNYYKTVSCANDLLKKSNDLGKNKQVTNLLGEIYFIRAYCYYTLARCFGNPPLVFNTDISYVIERPDYVAVYDSIEADLKRAIAFLPASFNESRVKYITPHRGTAKALLAEVYLTRGSYPLKDASAYRKAWLIAGEVIDSSAYYNFELAPDFANLWDGRHDMNSESVFSLFCLTRTQWSWAKWDTIYRTKSDSLADLLKYKNVLIVGPGAPFGGGFTGVKFFNTFPQCYRKENTYQSRQLKLVPTNIVDTDYYNGDTFTFFRYIKDTFMYYKIKTVNDVPMKKYYSAVDSMETLSGWRSPINITTFSGNYYTGNVYYILRYAHTLLTFAEAKARDGQLDAAAFEAVNKIRRRANHVDLNSPSKYDLNPGMESIAFIDSVVCERAYEFCGEPGNRWFDIVRTEQVSKIPNLVSPLHSFPIPFNRSTNFFDLPSIDKNLNPGLYN
jgi:starch-binding outer membrane protein, SusD/RagB family